MKLPKILREFLAKSDALSAFERNVRRQRDARARIINIESAFDWSDTPEGFDYWYKLNEEYKEYRSAEILKGII